VASGEWPELIW